jgi:DNA-binding Xre family transcriptional regulator
MSAAYRLTAAEGRLQFFDADLLEALCDVLGIGPDKLLERGSKKRARS